MLRLVGGVNRAAGDITRVLQRVIDAVLLMNAKGKTLSPIRLFSCRCVRVAQAAEPKVVGSSSLALWNRQS